MQPEAWVLGSSSTLIIIIDASLIMQPGLVIEHALIIVASMTRSSGLWALVVIYDSCSSGLVDDAHHHLGQRRPPWGGPLRDWPA